MDAIRHVRLMAEYNRWTNRQLYASLRNLSSASLVAATGDRFGSIMAGLNQQLAGDALWLRRFASTGHFDRLLEANDWLPAPGSLDEPVSADLDQLADLRVRIDELITAWCGDLIFKDLDRVLVYRDLSGLPQQHQLGPLLSHFFNHQTHQRGRLSTLLQQAGVEAGLSELVRMPGFDPFSPLDGEAAPSDPHPAHAVAQSRSSIQAC